MLSIAAATKVTTMNVGFTGSRISWRATTSISGTSASFLRRRRALRLFRRPLGHPLFGVNDQHLFVVRYACQRLAEDPREDECRVALHVHDLRDRQSRRV